MHGPGFIIQVKEFRRWAFRVWGSGCAIRWWGSVGLVFDLGSGPRVLLGFKVQGQGFGREDFKLTAMANGRGTVQIACKIYGYIPARV